MNVFWTVKKFLVPTEIGLKRFDKSGFKSGEVERSTSSGKDREFDVTDLAGTERVFQKMLSYSRIKMFLRFNINDTMHPLDQ